MNTKKPAYKWKPFQTSLADQATVRNWFGNGKGHGIAVVFGVVSDNLSSRDFDAPGAYEIWAQSHPDLAKSLPTVETRRGYHVYFQANPNDVVRIRASNGKPDGTGAICYADGELRVGTGCYSVLPPSQQLDGHVYRWLFPLPEQIPVVDDLIVAGLAQCNREAQRDPRTLLISERPGFSLVSKTPPSSLLHDERVKLAIRRTLPDQGGFRHRRLFDLARELKAIPGLADAQVSDLRPFVRQWHTLALPYILTKPFEESWFDFGESWDKVKFPKGTGPMANMFSMAIEAEVPNEALQYDQQDLRLLVALCRELQRSAGDHPFFLSTRTAGELLKIDHATASRWLRGMCRDKILELVCKGSLKDRRASRFRYLGNLKGG